MSEQAQDLYAWDGSGLKFAVSMTCEGFDMDEDDWKITVVRGPAKVDFTPANSVRDDDGQWYICVDTADLGPGDYDIIFDASVPDDDFDGGIRHEVQRYRLINVRLTV